MMHVDCSKPLGAVVSVTWRKITSTRVTETLKGELIFVIVPSVNSRAWRSLLTSHWSRILSLLDVAQNACQRVV